MLCVTVCFLSFYFLENSLQFVLSLLVVTVWDQVGVCLPFFFLNSTPHSYQNSNKHLYTSSCIVGDEEHMACVAMFCGVKPSLNLKFQDNLFYLQCYINLVLSSHY